MSDDESSDEEMGELNKYDDEGYGDEDDRERCLVISVQRSVAVLGCTK